MRPTEDKVYEFAGFLLDLARGALLSPAGMELPLRSKSFAMLRLLVENAGRLLDRDTIMTMVWPDVLVTDDSITQCAREIRAILGDDTQHLLRTIRGRGYMLSTSVSLRPVVPRSHEQDPGLLSSYGIGLSDSHVASTVLGAVGVRGDRPVADGPARDPLVTGPLATAMITEKFRPAFEPPRLSVVVLPFVNLTNDSDQQFLADGITMDLTTDLSRIRDALVISCNTAFTYRGKSVETTRIARELNVRFVMEGSVQRSGNHVRVNAQLIDGVTDSHVWAERFDGEIGDLAGLQDEVVSRIAGALNVELIQAEAARPNERADVTDCIFRGHSLRPQALSRDVYAQRITWYERACALDPRCVEALSWLAMLHAGRVLDFMSDRVMFDIGRAEDLIGQALAVSSHSPIAHFARGHLLRAQGRWSESIPEYEMALASNRNWAAAIGFLGGAKLFAGLLDDVIPLEERAIRLSPRDPQVWIFYLYIGINHLICFHFDEAVWWLQRSRSCNIAVATPNGFLAAAYAQTGDAGRAGFHLAEARRLSGGYYASTGRIKVWMEANVPKVATLLERTYLAGLAKAGVPES